ncbi:MAG: hypothetical protein M3548_14015 [Actinomycetota bacterium]|nr:hypothetical protein [Actinomycetota bacterium]
MAGDIWINEDARWPVNSSLYHWVLEFLILNLDDLDTVANLEEIRDNNLGIVDVEDYPLPMRERIVTLLRDELVPDATVRLPHDMRNRDGYIDALGELALMAQSVHSF